MSKKFNAPGRPVEAPEMANRAIVKFCADPVVGISGLAAVAILLARRSDMAERVLGTPLVKNGEGFDKLTGEAAGEGPGVGPKIASWVLGGVCTRTGRVFPPKPISGRNYKGRAGLPKGQGEDWIDTARWVAHHHRAQLGRQEVANGGFTAALETVEEKHGVPGLVAAFKAIQAAGEEARLATPQPQPQPQPQAAPRRAQGRPPAELAHALVRPDAPMRGQ